MERSAIRDHSHTAPDFAALHPGYGRSHLPLAAALLGSLVVCVCNLGAKNIAGFTSELLILGAKDAAGNMIVLGPRSEGRDRRAGLLTPRGAGVILFEGTSAGYASVDAASIHAYRI